MHQNLSLSVLVEFCLKLPGLMDGVRKKEVGISCDRYKTLLKERFYVPKNSESEFFKTSLNLVASRSL